MWKRIVFLIVLIILIVIGIEWFNKTKNKKQNEDINIIKQKNEISSTYVSDDCINEWDDYAKSREEEIKEASQSLNDSNRHYILKCEDNIVKVYYINEKKELILYKTTEISSEYLSEDEQIKLEKGIDIYGIENLNKLIEDLE